jgi:membrane associated rhomboid family serine protease
MTICHLLRHNRTWLSPCIKLIGALLVIPSTIAFLHLQTIFQPANICFVGPSPTSLQSDDPLSFDASKLYGIYRSPSSSRNNGSTPLNFSSDTIDRSKVSFIAKQRLVDGRQRIWNTFTNIILQRQGYPTLLSLQDDLMSTRSFTDAILFFDGIRGSWCFQDVKSNMKFCIGSESTGTSGVKENKNPYVLPRRLSEDVKGAFPPSGPSILIQSDNNSNQGSIYISCPVDGPSYLPEVVQNFWNGQMQKIRDNPNLEFLQIPTTSILILVNVLLAIIYFNNRTDPSLICKEYQKIVHENELWRSFTGATAHFEPLHIGFNMMSLYALGSELEPLYGSIPFLFYNICLIPLTTIVMMVTVWMQIRYTGDERLRNTKTVGYSAVLFAWMVVTSLERESTCPVPFMTNVCFKTYQFNMNDILKSATNSKWILKFNFGPLIQLLIAQVIMPRVSFLGHLAGIVCGFVLHWNLLPREVFYMPQVLIPAILMFHLWYVRRIISFQSRPDGYNRIDNDDALAIGTSAGMSRRKPDQTRIMIRQMRWIQRGMVVTTIMSILLFNSVGSVFLSQLLATAFTIFSSRWYFAERGQDTSNNSSSCALWKATIISLVLVILADAIQIPYWISMSAYISAKWSICNVFSLGAFLLLRFAMNFAALVVASCIITEIGPCRGAFEYVFGWVVKYGNMAHVVVGQQRTSNTAGFSAFQGQGVALGHA